MSTHRAFPKQKHSNTSRLADSAECPCISTKTYGTCCGQWHAGLEATPQRHAPTPEALMRSRYSAYVLTLGDYLLATWYGESSPGSIEFPPTKWLGLEVKHSAISGNGSGDAGIVEFVARYRDSTGKAGRLHETSRFIREGVGDAARWLYIDGQFAGEQDAADEDSRKPFRKLNRSDLGEHSQEIPE
jgi:SEC-C motif domain protein